MFKKENFDKGFKGSVTHIIWKIIEKIDSSKVGLESTFKGGTKNGLTHLCWYHTKLLRSLITPFFYYQTFIGLQRQANPMVERKLCQKSEFRPIFPFLVKNTITRNKLIWVLQWSFMMKEKSGAAHEKNPQKNIFCQKWQFVIFSFIYTS